MESKEQPIDRRVTLNIGIGTLLKALELEDSMNKLVIFQAKQRALRSYPKSYLMVIVRVMIFAG